MADKYDIEHRSYTHRYLWRTAIGLFELSKGEVRRPDYLHLSCMVMTFFALEAYLNFLGEILFPEVWKDERTFFNTPPYKGTMGKLAYLADHCGMSQLDKSRRPYQTVKNLHKIRDFMAHGRMEVIRKEVTFRPDRLPDFLPNFFDKHVSASAARKGLDDTEQLIKGLHDAAQKRFKTVRDLKLTPSPLSGTERFETGSSK